MDCILFIDDHVDDIESFRIWIEPKYKMLVAGNAKDAIKILSENINSVSVVVMDMKLEEDEDDLMPDSGLRLIKRIREITKRVQVIVLTGYYDNPYLKDCIEAGAMIYVLKARKNTRDLLLSFIDIAHKAYEEKSYFESLSTNYTELCQKHGELIRSYDNEIKAGKWFGRESISFKINKLSAVESNLTLENEWKTLYEISIGENIEINETIELEVNYIFEQVLGENTRQKIKGEISTAILKKIEGELSFGQTKHYKNAVNKKLKISRIIRKSLSLAEPANYNIRHVLKRKYEYTGLYDKYMLKVSITCSACDIYRMTDIILYVPNNNIATRLINYYNDGSIEKA